MSTGGYAGAGLGEPDLLDLTTDEAMVLRWQRGREARGLGPFDPFEGEPLRELYEELVDSLCYAREAGRRGLRMRVVERELRALAATVRALARNVERGVP